MSLDLLVSWMADVGTGSWRAFCRAADELLLDETTLPNELHRQLRTTLSDLGYADFFLQGTQMWRVVSPAIGGLESHPTSAALCGARTPQLVDAIAAAASTHGCQVSSEQRNRQPTGLFLKGSEVALEGTAHACGVSWVPSITRYFLRSFVPLPLQLDRAVHEPAPVNWSVRSFDLETLQWVDGLLPLSACEYAPRYGQPSYYLHTRRGALLRLSKRIAVYAAAMLRRVELLAYDHQARCLLAPLAAPVPELLARTACLCSGSTADVVSGRLCYQGVSPSTANVLLVALGQCGLVQHRSSGVVRYFDG